MKCPYCGHGDLRVTDSRNSLEPNAIRRRRECLGCEKRFTTFEVVELTVQVRKRDGRFEDFNQAKLIKGIDAACSHTKISHDQVIELAADITGELMQRQTREIDTVELGAMVMERLKRLDRVAYIRFACVYRRFKEFDEVIDEIQSMVEEDEQPHGIKAKNSLAGVWS